MMPANVLHGSSSTGGGRLVASSGYPRPSTAAYHHHYPQPPQQQQPPQVEQEEEEEDEDEEEEDRVDLSMLLRDDDGSKSLNCDEELGEEDAFDGASEAEVRPVRFSQSCACVREI